MAIEGTRWSSVVYAIVFFALFGFADEALRHYSNAWWTVAKVFGYRPKSSESSEYVPDANYSNRHSKLILLFFLHAEPEFWNITIDQYAM
jgi:hypothetical protein